MLVVTCETKNEKFVLEEHYLVLLGLNYCAISVSGHPKKNNRTCIILFINKFLYRDRLVSLHFQLMIQGIYMVTRL